MKRRNEKDLKIRVEQAKTVQAKAMAYYALALFHDNNAREAKAVPVYREALKLGLDRRTRSKALTWLASSLYKTGKPKEALIKIGQARVISDANLKYFLDGLEKRIKTRIKNSF